MSIGPAKDAAINFRTTRELRDQVELAAKAANRSIAQEIEFRLMRSFDVQSEQRTVIREEIRAALAERDESRLSADWLGPIPPTQMPYRY